MSAGLDETAGWWIKLRVPAQTDPLIHDSGRHEQQPRNDQEREYVNQSEIANSPGTMRRVRGSTSRYASNPTNTSMPTKTTSLMVSSFRECAGSTTHSTPRIGC